jgi:hypothetical protein
MRRNASCVPIGRPMHSHTYPKERAPAGELDPPGRRSVGARSSMVTTSRSRGGRASTPPCPNDDSATSRETLPRPGRRLRRVPGPVAEAAWPLIGRGIRRRGLQAHRHSALATEPAFRASSRSPSRRDSAPPATALEPTDSRGESSSRSYSPLCSGLVIDSIAPWDRTSPRTLRRRRGSGSSARRGCSPTPPERSAEKTSKSRR